MAPSLAQFPLADVADANDRYEYRPLKVEAKRQRGWDVVGLQLALIYLGYPLPHYGADGYLGDETGLAIWRIQQSTPELIDDGIAGVATQRHCILKICDNLRGDLPKGLPNGHVEFECSYQFGNFTPPYKDGKRDLGVTQRNLEVTDAHCNLAFNPVAAINFLVRDPERGLRARKDRYRKQLGTRGSDRLAWQLAVGSWNAPSVTNAYAEGKRTTLPDYLLNYIAHATAYVTDWTP